MFIPDVTYLKLTMSREKKILHFIMFGRYINIRFKPLIEQLCNSSNVISNLIGWRQFKRQKGDSYLPYSYIIAVGCMECSFKCEMPDPMNYCKVHALFFTVENKSRSCLHERERFGCSYICSRMQRDGHLLFESCLRSLCTATLWKPWLLWS